MTLQAKSLVSSERFSISELMINNKNLPHAFAGDKVKINDEEIDRAVKIVRKRGISDLTLLHCESRYPAVPELFNLNSIPYLNL